MYPISEILTILGLTGAFGFAFDMIGLYLTVRVLQKRIYSIITNYITELIADIQANPEKIQPIIDAAIKAGMKTLSQPGVAPKQAMIKLPFIGKVPLDMIMPFAEPYLKKAMGSAAQTGAEAASGF